MQTQAEIIAVIQSVAPEKLPDPAPDDSLFQSGLLDSFALPDLVAAPEREFGVEIPDSDLIPRKFAPSHAFRPTWPPDSDPVAFLLAFGSYLPERAVDNETLAALAGCEATWIREVSGIEQRRFAADGEGVVEMGAAAARDCLDRAGLTPVQVGFLVVASGSAPRRFPGPAVSIAHALGLPGVPALDFPMASAGALFGLHVAVQLAAVHGYVLVVASEKMSSVVLQEPVDKNVAILFGDGAGACLVAPDAGVAEVLAARLHSDGSFSEDLRLELTGPLRMAGHTVILQASRKIPSAIGEVLAATGLAASSVEVFLLHQANRNLITRVAGAVGAPVERFYSNIARFSNTSSASMLIAAAEWFAVNSLAPGAPAVFAAFGAGFHWGAIAVRGA